MIKLGTINDMKSLWADNENKTYNYFSEGIKSGNIEMITTENLHGELYIFWDSEDKDEANGINRAYLCALRVQSEFQDHGIASAMVEYAIKRIKQRGYTSITIGVDLGDYERLKSIYEHWGFNEFIKTVYEDFHGFTKNGERYYDPKGWPLLLFEFNRS